MTESEHPPTIMTIGSSEERSQICKAVRMSLALKSGRTKDLMLFTVPIICELLTCQLISLCQANFDHLAGIDLADPADGHLHLEINILVGTDQY